MTRNEAIALASTRWWRQLPPEEVFWFQLNEDLLCMDFADFHAITEKVLGRSVWTHEFANRENLRSEFLKERPAPSLADIFAILPAEKTIVVGLEVTQ